MVAATRLITIGPPIAAPRYHKLRGCGSAPTCPSMETVSVIGSSLRMART